MVARTPWQAAATAAAGEVTEGSGLGVSSAGSFFWSGNISRAWGSGLGIVGGVFVEMNDEFVFTMDTPTCRSKLLF